MAQLRFAHLAAALALLSTSGCVVSFDGYELGSSDAGSGATTSSGGTAGSGATGGATGGTGGATGGTGGATGGTGGATGGTGGATGGTGGATGGTGGATGGTGGATGGTGGATGGTGGATGGTGGAFTCPSISSTGLLQPVPAAAGNFCIDGTEVTQGQYSAWLASAPTNTLPACSGNSSFTPSCNFTPSSTPQKPVVCVDWCDAYAYCASFGKHLCGKIGGGFLPASGLSDKAQDEWYAACSKDGTRAYPYSNVSDDYACVGLNNNNFFTAQNVGSVSTCQGGYPLIYDMSGNVEEWQDSCDASNNCTVRGGNYLDLPAQLSCTSAPTYGRLTNDKKRGFRCCY